MTPLRKRFLEDLQLRNYAPNHPHLPRRVVRFAPYFRRSPELLGPEDVRAYQLHLLHERHASWATFNQAVSPCASSTASPWDDPTSSR